MKRKIRNSTFLVLIVLFIALALFLYFASNKKDSLEILFYNEKSDINYEVCLKENQFYEEKCQPKDMSYIASAIDYINVTFNYAFETEPKINYTYEYYIDGIITVYDRNNPGNILFSKITKILDKQELIKEDVNSFIINENLKIDYNKYNDLISSFKNEYNVLADSNLKLVLYIKAIADYDKFDDSINTSSEMELVIPLTENTIKINMDYKEINNSDKFIQQATKNIMNNIYFILSIVCAVSAIGIASVYVFYLYKAENMKSEYDRFIKNKLKNFDRMIISAKGNVKINEEDYAEVIDVENFTELIDIAERIVGMIAWTEVIQPKKKVSWFTVADDKRLYRVIYNSTDKEFK